jgi:hypothetical protein
MNSNSKLLLETMVSGVLLGALGDVLLRAGPWGLNLTLWVLMVTTAVFGIALRHGIEWPRPTKLIIGLIVVFAAGFAWRANPVLKLG